MITTFQRLLFGNHILSDLRLNTLEKKRVGVNIRPFRYVHRQHVVQVLAESQILYRRFHRGIRFLKTLNYIT